LKKSYKIILFLFCLSIVFGFIWYFNLSNRHQAIVKTYILYSFNIVDSEWVIDRDTQDIEFISPTFHIDNIYKSMEGPKASKYFSLDLTKDNLYWMTAFQVKAIDSKTKNPISNDFVCHFNIDYQDQVHHGKWNLLDRVNKQYPRLLSLSHGIENIKFPKGYGFPFFSNEKFFIITQALNHNITDSSFNVKHKIKIEYSNKKTLKPLFPKTIFMMLPFKPDAMDIPKDEISANSCIPVETKNHTYRNQKGETLSSHWKIFKEQKKYTFNATSQLAIKDTLTLHQITPHLHPFAKKFTLKDITNNTTVYTSNIINHDKGIGLTSTSAFYSKEGVKMYPTHEYELELITSSTLEEPQDMMASMFLFFYDKEMDLKIKKYLHEN
jgi:hypothetical protein